jgi:hypothetical protein
MTGDLFGTMLISESNILASLNGYVASMRASPHLQEKPEG